MADAQDQTLSDAGVNPTPPANGQQFDNTIGVPKGYKPPKEMRKTQYGTTVPYSAMLDQPMVGSNNMGGQYVSGDEWLPLNDPTKLISLQAQLVQAGLISAKEIRLGVWDTKSASAYRTVLAFANANGVSSTQALDFLEKNPAVGAQTPKNKTTHVLTNPEDSKQAFATAAQQLTGGDLPSSEAEQFANNYMADEKRAYAQNDAQQGGNVTGTASPSNAATAFVQAHNKDDAVAFGTASRMLQFFQMLKTPG
jgi:hypothetical protein